MLATAVDNYAAPTMAEPTPSRTPSRWNGLSTEERQRERRRLLLDAAANLLASEGSAGTTVRAVCAEARLNPRYFYESFEDLDALVVAAYDDVVVQLRKQVTAAVSAAEDDDAAMRAAIEATVRFVDEDRRRGRILYIEALGNEALNLRRIQTGVGLVELVQVDTSRRRKGTPDTTAGRMGAAVLVGGFSELLVDWIEGRLDVTADRLVDDATQIFIAVRDAAAALGARA